MPPNRAAFFLRSFGAPQRGAAHRAVQAFWAPPKTLAQGQFTCPEHIPSTGGPRAAAPHGARKKCGLKAARRAPQFSKR